MTTEASSQLVLERADFRAVHWVTGEKAQAALASAAGDTDRMTSGLPGVVLAVLSAADDPNRGTR